MNHVVDMEVQGSKMLGVKIIEVNTDNGCEEIIGKCGLYMFTKYCEYSEITIEFPDGKTDYFYGYYWDSGSYYELNIDNYLNFYEWLSKYDFNKEEYYSDKYGYFEKLLDLYYEEKENDTKI